MYCKYIKIIFTILSFCIIFYYTNIAKPSKSTIDDGNYLNNNTFMGQLINHKPGYVCPLGVILGKLMIIGSFIQLYYISKNNYKAIRLANSIILVIAYILSFMNKKLQHNITSALIMQLFIIILPDK
tara:strand:- start:128 stop:508 length:381 start_codon:yes stop_codon:yes gene_type:complete